jgi:hypothetical protein
MQQITYVDSTYVTIQADDSYCIGQLKHSYFLWTLERNIWKSGVQHVTLVAALTNYWSLSF